MVTVVKVVKEEGKTCKRRIIKFVGTKKIESPNLQMLPPLFKVISLTTSLSTQSCYFSS